MALQVAFSSLTSPLASSSLSLSSPSPSSSSLSSSSSSSASSRLCFPVSPSSFSYLCRKSGHHPGNERSDASITIVRAVEQVDLDTRRSGGVMEVTQENFWTVVAEAADRLVVLDMYTQGCGPCKLMYPKVVDLSLKHSDAVFLKLNCNQENKALAKSLGVKAVPTFKLFKKGKEIAEVKGAKYDELVRKIEEAKAADL